MSLLCGFSYHSIEAGILVVCLDIGFDNETHLQMSYIALVEMHTLCLIYFLSDYTSLSTEISGVCLDFLRISSIVIMTFDPGQLEQDCQLHIWFHDSVGHIFIATSD